MFSTYLIKGRKKRGTLFQGSVVNRLPFDWSETRAGRTEKNRSGSSKAPAVDPAEAPAVVTAVAVVAVARKTERMSRESWESHIVEEEEERSGDGASGRPRES